MNLRNSAEIPREWLGALQEITETREGLRIKLVDRMPALNLLFRHLRLLPMPGTKEDPLQLEHTMKETDLDFFQLTVEQLVQLRDTLGAMLS